MTRNAAVVLLMSIVASEAPAQLPPQPRVGGGTSLLQTRFTPQGLTLGFCSLNGLLNNPKVSTELRMSESQRKDWETVSTELNLRRDAVNRETNARHSELIAKVRQSRIDDGPESVNYQKIEGQLVNLEAQIRNQVTAVVDAVEESLPKLLDPKQMARLREIRLQEEGLNAFKRHAIQATLALAPEQKTTIYQASFQYGRRLRKVSMLPPGVKSPGEMITNDAEREANALAIEKIIAEMVKTRTEALKSVDAILTDVQREAYRKAIGPDFDFFGTKDSNDAQGKDVEK